MLIKFIISIFLILFSCVNTVIAKPGLVIRGDISQVVSFDGPYEKKYSNAVRQRAIVENSLGGEMYQSLVIERFAPGRYGKEDKILLSKRVSIPSLPEIKKYVKNLEKKSTEVTYGCCLVQNLSWKNYKLHFEVNHRDKVFKCHSSDVRSSNFSINCFN